MATPTRATGNVAHAAVGLDAAIVVPTLIGKGRGGAIIAGIAGTVLHMLLPTTRQVMADHRLQF